MGDGRLFGSRASHRASSSVVSTKGFDPGRVAARITKDDPYLTEYLLGWFGLADPQPWDAAMSFAMEVAYGLGLIKSEINTTATPLGLAVADILHKQSTKGDGFANNESVTDHGL